MKAIKQIDAVNIYRLKNEFRQLADISHANLVGLHELVCDDQSWFFTMELVDGQSFDAYVAADRQPTGEYDSSQNPTAVLRPLSAQVRIPKPRLVSSAGPLPPACCDLGRLRSVLRQLVDGTKRSALRAGRAK